MKTVVAVALAAISSILCEPREEPGSPEAGSVRTRDPASPNAHLEIAEELRQDLAAQRHPSDGGGRAWIEPDSESSGTTRSTPFP